MFITALFSSLLFVLVLILVWVTYDSGYSGLAVFLGCLAGVLLFTLFIVCYEGGKQEIFNSKICPQCYSFYSKEDSYCLEDGAKLNLIVPEEAKEKYNGET